jgi:parvulin-like peptidyl-prolyl cis-trans isomerase-like protein
MESANGPGPRELRIQQTVLDAIARARGVSAEQALELGSEDALLAQHLSERDPKVGRWIQRVVLARQLLGALVEEAKAGGPPTDAEVQSISEARFWELDRPRMVQVAHAVVMSSDENIVARSLAERIAAATAGAATSESFQAAARAVPAGNLTVRVEALPPVALDGRAVDPAKPPPAGPPVQQFDLDFVAAAQRLERPGQQSPVVRSAFGYHVIYLIASIEPKRPALDERRALLHDEIMSQRANALSAALLQKARSELAPEQERSALSSMQAIGGVR